MKKRIWNQLKKAVMITAAVGILGAGAVSAADAGLSPQMRRVRHHRRGRPQHGVPLLLQMQRLLLLLHEAYQ